MSNRTRGFVAVIISAVIFGCMPLMAKYTYSQGSNPLSTTFYRFFLPLPALFLLVKSNKNVSVSISFDELKKVAIAAIFGFGATALLLFMSYNYIPSGMATTIHFIYPVFVIVGCILFFKEKPSIVKIISAALCVVGIVMFYDKEGQINIVGMALAFASGITFSFYTVYLDKSGLKEMNNFKLTFYLCSVSSVMLLIFSVVSGSFTYAVTLSGWAMLLGLALLVSLGAVCLFQLGVKVIGPQNTAILSTFEPITSIVIGVFIFRESFGLRTFLGVVMILSAITLVSVLDK